MPPANPGQFRCVRRCGAFKWVQVPPGERSSWKQSASFPSLPARFFATCASPPKSCEGRTEISHATPPKNNTIATTTCAADGKTRWSVNHRHEQFCTDARRWQVQEWPEQTRFFLSLNNHGVSRWPCPNALARFLGNFQPNFLSIASGASWRIVEFSDAQTAPLWYHRGR
jgi:hypothetical protein